MAGGEGLAMGEPFGTFTVVMVTFAGELLGAIKNSKRTSVSFTIILAYY